MKPSTKKLLESIYKKDDDLVKGCDIGVPDPIPTPSPSVNWAMSGGLVPGRLYCFEGPKSGGKTMFAMACVAELLKANPDGVVYWFDAEFSLTDHWKNVFGITGDDAIRLIIKPTNDPEKIFDYFTSNILKRIEEDGLQVVGCVLDSLQSIVPPKEANRKKSTDAQYAALAGYLPGALRQILEPSRKHEVPWIIVSQVRQDMSAGPYGDKYKISGGESFYHAIDGELQFTARMGKDDKIINENVKNMNEKDSVRGHQVQMKVKKNRLGTPYRIARFSLDYDRGLVDLPKEIMRLGLNLGIVTIDGKTYHLNGQKLAVGAAKALEVIESSQAMQNEILKAVMEKSDEENKNNKEKNKNHSAAPEDET